MTATRNRYPQDHEPFPQLERRRLVRVRISPDPTVVAINFREAIFPLQHQMGLYRRAAHIRDRIFNMRQCAFFRGLHHWKSHLRDWFRRDLFWKSHHRCKPGPS